MGVFHTSATPKCEISVNGTVMMPATHPFSGESDMAGCPLALEQRLTGTKSTFSTIGHPCQIPYGVVTRGEYGGVLSIQTSGEVTLPMYESIHDIIPADVGMRLIACPYNGGMQLGTARTHPVPSAATLGLITGVDTDNQTFTMVLDPRPANCHAVDFRTDSAIEVGTPVVVEPTTGKLVTGLDLLIDAEGIPAGVVWADGINRGGAQRTTSVITDGVVRMLTTRLTKWIQYTGMPLEAGFRINRAGELLVDFAPKSNLNQYYTLGTLSEYIPDGDPAKVPQRVMVDVCPEIRGEPKPTNEV